MKCPIVIHQCLEAINGEIGKVHSVAKHVTELVEVSIKYCI